VSHDRDPFWGYSDLALFAGALLPSGLLAVAGAVLLGWLAPQLLESKALIAIGLQFVAYGIWFVGLWAIFRFRYGRPFWESLGWRGGPAVGRCLAWGPPLALGISLLGALLGTPNVKMPIEELLRDRTSMIIVGLIAVTLAPVCEELIFRGFLQPLLSRSLGAALGILIAASPFALLHGPEYGWSWRHVALIGLAGVGFGWARYATASTAAAAAMHSTYNLTIFLGYLALRSQGMD
jgi:membrane protease YdiL (CAAX protease family)